jgi:hypothetical protein
MQWLTLNEIHDEMLLVCGVVHEMDAQFPRFVMLDICAGQAVRLCAFYVHLGTAGCVVLRDSCFTCECE